MRDTHNPKSQEHRPNALGTNDGKTRPSGGSLQFNKTKYEKSQGILKKGQNSLTQKNQNSSSYARGDRLLSYKQIEFDGQGHNGSQNLPRDPYQGFN